MAVGRPRHHETDPEIDYVAKAISYLPKPTASGYESAA